MEREKYQRKLTPEERKMEVRRQMYVELKAMEMERRQTVALETMEKCKREREEREKTTESLRRQKEKNQERMRQEAKKREEERRANEQKALEKTKQNQLKKERLQWTKVMMVEEEPVKRPMCTSSALKKEQQRRPELLTSDLKSEEQGKKQTLHNNWVGEQKTDCEPVSEKFHPNSATYLLFAAKPGPKPEEKPKAPKSKETLQSLQRRLKVGYWLDKYRDYSEKKDEKHKLKTEEQYARWTAAKASHVSRCTRRFDYYMEEFPLGRNNILKSIF